MAIDYRGCFLLAGALVANSLAGAGCLPDPKITVPDFSPVAPTDAGMPADLVSRGQMDLASPDLAPAVKWTADGAPVSMDTVRAVWVADPALNEAFAVGQNGLILHRTGGTWQKEQAKDGGGKVITTNLYGVAAASPATVYAVGENGVILRRSGGMWTQEGLELMTSVSFFGATVVDTGEVIVVGDGATIARRQTTGTYVAEDTTALPTANFRAVAGGTLATVMAVGLNAVVAQRMAGKWQADPFPINAMDAGNYYAISMGPDGTFLAGEYTRVLKRGASSWTHENTITPMPPTLWHLYSLANTTAGELFAVGSGGVVERRDGKTQTWSLEGSGVSVDLYGVSGLALDSAVAVGAQGTLLKHL